MCRVQPPLVSDPWELVRQGGAFNIGCGLRISQDAGSKLWYVYNRPWEIEFDLKCHRGEDTKSHKPKGFKEPQEAIEFARSILSDPANAEALGIEFEEWQIAQQ